MPASLPHTESIVLPRAVERWLTALDYVVEPPALILREQLWQSETFQSRTYAALERFSSWIDEISSLTDTLGLDSFQPLTLSPVVINEDSDRAIVPLQSPDRSLLPAPWLLSNGEFPLEPAPLLMLLPEGFLEALDPSSPLSSTLLAPLQSTVRPETSSSTPPTDRARPIRSTDPTSNSSEEAETHDRSANLRAEQRLVPYRRIASGAARERMSPLNRNRGAFPPPSPLGRSVSSFTTSWPLLLDPTSALSTALTPRTFDPETAPNPRRSVAFHSPPPPTTALTPLGPSLASSLRPLPLATLDPEQWLRPSSARTGVLLPDASTDTAPLVPLSSLASLLLLGLTAATKEGTQSVVSPPRGLPSSSSTAAPLVQPTPPVRSKPTDLAPTSSRRFPIRGIPLLEATKPQDSSSQNPIPRITDPRSSDPVANTDDDSLALVLRNPSPSSIVSRNDTFVLPSDTTAMTDRITHLWDVGATPSEPPLRPRFEELVAAGLLSMSYLVAQAIQSSARVDPNRSISVPLLEAPAKSDESKANSEHPSILATKKGEKEPERRFPVRGIRIRPQTEEKNQKTTAPEIQTPTSTALVTEARKSPTSETLLDQLLPALQQLALGLITARPWSKDEAFAPPSTVRIEEVVDVLPTIVQPQTLLLSAQPDEIQAPTHRPNQLRLLSVEDAFPLLELEPTETVLEPPFETRKTRVARDAIRLDPENLVRPKRANGPSRTPPTSDRYGSKALPTMSSLLSAPEISGPLTRYLVQALFVNQTVSTPRFTLDLKEPSLGVGLHVELLAARADAFRLTGKTSPRVEEELDEVSTPEQWQLTPDIPTSPSSVDLPKLFAEGLHRLETERHSTSRIEEIDDDIDLLPYLESDSTGSFISELEERESLAMPASQSLVLLESMETAPRNSSELAIVPLQPQKLSLQLASENWPMLRRAARQGGNPFLSSHRRSRHTNSSQSLAAESTEKSLVLRTLSLSEPDSVTTQPNKTERIQDLVGLIEERLASWQKVKQRMETHKSPGTSRMGKDELPRLKEENHRPVRGLRVGGKQAPELDTRAMESAIHEIRWRLKQEERWEREVR